MTKGNASKYKHIVHKVRPLSEFAMRERRHALGAADGKAHVRAGHGFLQRLALDDAVVALLHTLDDGDKQQLPNYRG